MLALEYRQCLCLALVIHPFFNYRIPPAATPRGIIIHWTNTYKYLTASIPEDHSSTTIDFCFC